MSFQGRKQSFHIKINHTKSHTSLIADGRLSAVVARNISDIEEEVMVGKCANVYRTESHVHGVSNSLRKLLKRAPLS